MHELSLKIIEFDDLKKIINIEIYGRNKLINAIINNSITILILLKKAYYQKGIYLFTTIQM